MRRWLALAIIITAALDSPSEAARATFEVLEGLTGGIGRCEVCAISGDGSTVVGVIQSPFRIRQAFRWTRQEGIILLGSPDSNLISSAYGVSYDGSVLVGESGPFNGGEAFRWSESEGMIGLGKLGGHWSAARDVSSDGNTVVGLSINSRGRYQPFIWTADKGMVGLEIDPFVLRSSAMAVSGNGSIVAGYVESCGFYYTESEGMQEISCDLHPLGGFPVCGISADGSTIVGWIDTGRRTFQAFKWTKPQGIQLLTDSQPENTTSRANAVSGDGSIIVGYGPAGDEYSQDNDAFIWDAENGMRNLTEVLENDYDLQLPFRLVTAKAISDDGLVIAGNSLGNGWVVTLPPPIEIAMRLTPKSLNRSSKGRWITAHISLPEDCTAADVDINRPCRITEPFEGDIESAFVNVITNNDGSVVIEAAFDRSVFPLAEISEDTVEVRVEGRLIGGQRFYGFDTIRVIK